MKKTVFILALCVVLLAALRIWFATQGLDLTAYHLVRQIEHIQENGLPFFYDQLSFGGKEVVVHPVYPYAMSLLASIFGNFIALHILPNIFAALIIAAVYVFVRQEGRIIALLTSAMAAFIPVFFAGTINTASSLTIAVPILIVIAHLYVTSFTQQTSRKPFFYFACILLLLAPAAWIWLIGFGVYFFFCWLERIKTGKWEREAFLSLCFVGLTWLVILYHKALFVHGFAVLWQNIPLVLRSVAFQEFNLFTAISLIGVLPFIGAFFVFYDQAYQKKDKKTVWIAGQFVATFLLLVFTFIPFQTGLMLLSIWLILLFPTFYKMIISYLETTKFSSYKVAVPWLVLMGILLLHVIPSVVLAQQQTTVDIVPIAEFLNNQSSPNATIIASPEYGALLAHMAKRETFLDTDFLLAPQAERRIIEYQKITNATFTNTVLEILEDHQIEQAYIITDNQENVFSRDTECFVPEIAHQTTTAYRVACSLKEK